METFQSSGYGFPERKEMDQLADFFNVSKRKVENWFSAKRRTLAKRGMLPLSE